MQEIFSMFLLCFLLIMQSNSFAEQTLEKATFAGGCFWCMESDFEKIKGVKKVVSGYTGGTGENPTYEDYSKKGHIEAVEVYYDPSQTTYKELVNIFWRKIDPTDAGGQFCDRGHAYTTAIFYHTEDQKHFAEQSKDMLEKSGLLQKPVATEIIKAGRFYAAEDYHQGYYKKNPIRYKLYRLNCRRDQRLKEIWDTKTQLKKRLTPLQYKVTQEDGTEPPFN
ncbi:MAG: peptide-methionine (S)-S-oxide reductase MsrA, partial [Candidatus Omnitrophota bacterium]